MSEARRRLFIALPIPPAVAAKIAEGAALLRSGTEGLRWTVAATTGEEGVHYHVTLWFIGSCEESRVPSLVQEIASVATDFLPFRLAVGGHDWFTRGGTISVLYRVLEGEVELLESLAGRLVALAQGKDAPHLYRPHITIARGLAKRPAQVRDLEKALASIKPFPVLDFMAEEIILFNSTLMREGPVYTPVARFALGGGVPVQ